MSHSADVEPGLSSEASYQSDAVTNGKHCSQCQRVMGPDWERGACGDCERRDGEKAKEHRSNLKVVLARQASATAGSGRHDIGNMPSSVRCISYFKLRQPTCADVFPVYLLVSPYSCEFPCGILPLRVGCQFYTSS